jgi:plastocyanin
MLRIALALALAALLAPLAFAATTEVKLRDNFFEPERVTIDKGDKVRWVWKGSDLHNVAVRKLNRRAIARASEFMVNGKFTHRFRKAGTWKILCENHPRKMRMKVIVRAP